MAHIARPSIIALGDLCTKYAEKYGIYSYRVDEKTGKMIYYSSFPIERNTYRCEVDFSGGHERETRQRMFRYYGIGGRIGSCTVLCRA